MQQELRAGRKQTHWMWFVFPHLATLGRSATARHCGIAGRVEARAYLAHPVLGLRLRKACSLLLALPTQDPVQVFGAGDAVKLRYCLTLSVAARRRTSCSRAACSASSRARRIR